MFVSYSRSAGHVKEWVWNHFYPNLKKCLEDQLGDTRIFIDKQMNEKVGLPWPEMLADSLGKSRLLVPVLSPPYFQSEWCVAEWGTMEKREEQVGAPGLIYPVVFADGKRFPENVRNRQLYRRFKKYNNPYPSYKDTQSYDDFYREVGRLAQRISNRLNDVPPWCDDWPVLRPPAGKPRAAQMPRLGA
ncbi:TIR domain-containing protein [Streptomyces sp. NPDC002730]|uniref:TIR domain-containing protein n=1 Tax=Streptomyces sp. NPDC002730 TaxID=3364662 RepID=UPI0036B82452